MLKDVKTLGRREILAGVDGTGFLTYNFCEMVNLGVDRRVINDPFEVLLISEPSIPD